MSLAGLSCVGYCRVSTDRQAGERQTSLGDQSRAVETLAAKLGRTVERWYRDEGASGATVAGRPQLRALLADCLAAPRPKSKPGYVLVLNDSRWGRFPNPDQAAAIRFQLDEVGWLVRFVEGDDSEDPTFRHVMRAIGGAQASEYRRNVQRNAKRGSRGTASQGFWGTRAPYGYRRKVVYPPGRERVLEAHQRKAPDEKVALTPHESEAAIVKDLFIGYASGTESVASMTAWLRDVAADRKWTRAAVRFTLGNPAYAGDVVSGRVDADAGERRPESEWIVQRDAHPPIVSRELYAAVQDILARNAKWTSRVRTDWLVSGIVLCPCGKPYVAGGSNRNQRHEETRSYRCVTKAGIVADRCAYPGSVKKQWLERAVVDTLTKVIAGPTYRRRLAAYLDVAIRALRNAPADAAAALTKDIDTATGQRDRLVQAVAEGTLTSEEAKDRLTTVRRLLARLEARRDALAEDRTSEARLDAERDRVLAIVTDFRAMARTVTGPALRELIRPWIARATFDPETRRLYMEIRAVPDFGHGDLNSMARPSSQSSGVTGHVTRRSVVVGGRR